VILDWYQAGGRLDGAPEPTLPEPLSSRLADPSRYRPSPDLVDAVNVALTLGQPLLLTGEPGSGKSQLAPHVAWSMGLPLLKFETKSNSSSVSLFYVYDALRQYRDTTLGSGKADARDYVSFAALGAAILRTLAPDERFGLPDADGPVKAVRSVVLIDEIDKAPRDFPNDLLNEIEHLYFRIPECDLTIEADRTLRPIVIITSNEERALPGPFLRRCVFHHVVFPEPEEVREIVLRQLGDVSGLDAITEDVLAAFATLRVPQSGLDRRPGLAELLGWIAAVRQQSDPTVTKLDIDTAKRTAGIVAKGTGDAQRAAIALDAWDQAGRPRA
jgi:MoxR-like ATPase